VNDYTLGIVFKAHSSNSVWNQAAGIYLVRGRPCGSGFGTRRQASTSRVVHSMGHVGGHPPSAQQGMGSGGDKS
jgi:hypothetical protein